MVFYDNCLSRFDGITVVFGEFTACCLGSLLLFLFYMFVVCDKSFQSINGERDFSYTPVFCVSCMRAATRTSENTSLFLFCLSI